MSHVILKNPATNKVEGVVCIDRESHTCHVLMADIDQLEKLVAIAKAQKVGTVRLVVPDASVRELEDRGWKKSDDLVVLVRE